MKTIDTMSNGIKINSIGAVSGTMETRFMQPMYPTKNAATIVPNSTPILECGCVELDANYTTFLNRLREAGIDEILADKQAQLDAWLIRQGLKSAM